MVHSTPFSPIEERWAEISDFPAYSVSDRGSVMNTVTGKIMSPSRNTRGLLMVGLMANGRQSKRGIAPLVADAFVPRPSNPVFDTVINRNGDRDDFHYLNLMWRPLWFARKYVQQFEVPHMTYDDVIEDIETGILYKDSYSAAVEHGLLEEHIVVSMTNNTYVWPTGQVFREALER